MNNFLSKYWEKDFWDIYNIVLFDTTENPIYIPRVELKKLHVEGDMQKGTNGTFRLVGILPQSKMLTQYEQDTFVNFSILYRECGNVTLYNFDNYIIEIFQCKLIEKTIQPLVITPMLVDYEVEIICHFESEQIKTV